MIIELDRDQRQDMSERSQDVSDVLRILRVAGNTEATRESAYLAWAEHSERSAANWLIVAKDPMGFAEITAAHDALVRNRANRSIIAEQGEDRAEPAPSRTVPVGKPTPREDDPANRKALADLKAIGFDPPVGVTRSEERIDRMRHIAGRLSNVRYMANAIDAMDGIPEGLRAPAVQNGDKQLRHMLGNGIPELNMGGRCYVALRRAEREGDMAALRTGLVMMVTADNREIGYADVLTALKQDGLPLREVSKDASVQATSGKPERIIRSTGTKGPADGMPALMAPGMGKGGVER
jgi:hypothetical protein